VTCCLSIPALRDDKMLASLMGLQYHSKCKQMLLTILRSRLVAQAVLLWGEKHWELFKTFLTDQLKLLMEGLMDPSKPQKYLADQEMYRRCIARQRQNEASRQDRLLYLYHCLQEGPCYNVCGVQVASILPGADCVCSIFSNQKLLNVHADSCSCPCQT